MMLKLHSLWRENCLFKWRLRGLIWFPNLIQDYVMVGHANYFFIDGRFYFLLKTKGNKGGSAWRGHTKASEMVDVDLGASYMDLFSLWEFNELYTLMACALLCICYTSIKFYKILEAWYANLCMGGVLLAHPNWGWLGRADQEEGLWTIGRPAPPPDQTFSPTLGRGDILHISLLL